MILRHDAYELFRRAVIDRDAHAWGEATSGYRVMIAGWARRSQAAEISGERNEDLADEALVRAWKELSPERFAKIPSQAALLAYLRACLASTAIDAGRTRALKSDRSEYDYGTPLELELAGHMSRAELWQLTLRIAASDAERLVLYDRFVLGLPSLAIQQRHPAVFPELRNVYETIRSLSEQLRRSQELRRSVGDNLAA